jgi:hypothetical protein
MKVQEVILRAMAKKITWCQAAEIIGVSDRRMRRWRERSNGLGHGSVTVDSVEKVGFRTETRAVVRQNYIGLKIIDPVEK